MTSNSAAACVIRGIRWWLLAAQVVAGMTSSLTVTAQSGQELTLVFGNHASIRINAAEVIPGRWCGKSRSAPAYLLDNSGAPRLVIMRGETHGECNEKLQRNPVRFGAAPDALLVRMPGSPTTFISFQTNQSKIEWNHSALSHLNNGSLSSTLYDYDTTNDTWSPLCQQELGHNS